MTIKNGSNSQWLPITAYDAIQTLPKCDIAWEFLRRNADYRRDVERFGSDAMIRDEDWHGIRVYRQTRSCEVAGALGPHGIVHTQRSCTNPELILDDE